MAVVDLLAAQGVWNATQVPPYISVLNEVPLIDYDPGGSVPWPDTLEMIYNVSIAVEGDVDGDGFVGGGDYNLVLSNWGAGSPTEPAGVPEPATLGMVLLGGLALLRRWRVERGLMVGKAVSRGSFKKPPTVPGANNKKDMDPVSSTG